jgi:hypothetical protein
MFGALAFLVHLALAGEGWWLESAESPDRTVATAVESTANRDGFHARVVKRFRLGDGWMHVALVEGFEDEVSASEAARRLTKETGVSFTIVNAPARGKPVAHAAAAPPPAPSRDAVTAASAVARCLEAHGGPTGGGAALARAPGLHFRFTRTFSVDGKSVTVTHDYWRDASSRRLEVTGGGFGTDSVLVATAGGAWIAAGGKVEARDVGVLITQADAFSPEVILGPALDVPGLFGGSDLGTLMLLEGAESGVRVGRGEDPAGSGFAFADVDSATGLLHRVRYVTDAGPVVYRFSGWRSRADGLVVPARVNIERADGRAEDVEVQALELPEKLPSGTFVPPSIDTPRP